MELHDEIGQSMTAINMTLQSIRTGELKDNKIKKRIPLKKVQIPKLKEFPFAESCLLDELYISERE